MYLDGLSIPSKNVYNRSISCNRSVVVIDIFQGKDAKPEEYDTNMRRDDAYNGI